MSLVDPTFPPLMNGIAVLLPDDPFQCARDATQRGECEAGDLFWSNSENTMQFALVLEPEVSRQRYYEMLFLGMVAFSDAIGAVAPPEVAVTFLWPSTILVNGGIAGLASLAITQTDEETPDWIVFGLEIQIAPKEADIDPGLRVSRTTLHMEGCGYIDRTMLLESTARHLLNWIYTWGEDGFSPIHREWVGRHHDEERMFILPDETKSCELINGTWLGMDENGNALVKSDESEPKLLLTETVLKDM